MESMSHVLPTKMHTHMHPQASFCIHSIAKEWLGPAICWWLEVFKVFVFTCIISVQPQEHIKGPGSARTFGVQINILIRRKGWTNLKEKRRLFLNVLEVNTMFKNNFYQTSLNTMLALPAKMSYQQILKHQKRIWSQVYIFRPQAKKLL